MIRITAVYGSPRRKGNTATLLRHAVDGARKAGADVEEIVLRDLKISPCLEIYGCQKSGECVIRDDFSRVRDALMGADGLMFASPIFFYSVSAHTKILMDRCQSLWVRKYQIASSANTLPEPSRKVLFIAVGATRGKRLFDGALMTMRYFLDVLNATLWRSLLYRGIDREGEILEHPDHLDEAREAGRQLVAAIRTDKGDTASC